MANMDTNSSVGVGVGLFIVLFIAYLYLESRENDARGVKHFSPQKLGKVLKKTFSLCLPDFILLAFANLFIFCGFVGNSCMENILSDEDVREAKKMARLAATLSRGKGKSSKKKSKHRRGDDGDGGSEEGLFSGDNDSDISDMENGSVDSGHRRSSHRRSKSKSRSRHSRSDDMDRSDSNLTLSDSELTTPDSKLTLPIFNDSSNEPPEQSFAGLTHSRAKVEKVSATSFQSPSSPPPREEKLSRSERRERRLDLSQHSAKSSAVSRESLQALIAAEDVALGHRS